jgi:hypothetical protein
LTTICRFVISYAFCWLFIVVQQLQFPGEIQLEESAIIITILQIANRRILNIPYPQQWIHGGPPLLVLLPLSSFGTCCCNWLTAGLLHVSTVWHRLRVGGDFREIWTPWDPSVRFQSPPDVSRSFLINISILVGF